MTSTQPAASAERRAPSPSCARLKSPNRTRDLRTPHKLILMEMDSEPESLMPIYEYICQKCNHQFEALLYGKEKAECPKCHATKLAPQLSVFAVSAGSSKSSAPSASPSGGCGSCGDPRGPGACSLGEMN